MITVKIFPNDKGNPPGKLADIELHFAEQERMMCPDCYGDREVPANDSASGEKFMGICGTCDGRGYLTQDAALGGLKLCGFAIWERRGGGRNVTWPARQYSVNGERQSFALLRPAGQADGTVTGHENDRLRDAILGAFVEYQQAIAEGRDGPSPALRIGLAAALPDLVTA